MHQNIKEYNVINSIINGRTPQPVESVSSRRGPQLLLENEQLEADSARKQEELKKKKEEAKKAELDALDARKKELSSTNEDCPHTDGHDHNEDYCAMVREQLQKSGQIIGMIQSMLPKNADLPSEIKEKISSAMGSLAGAASAMRDASSKQDGDKEKEDRPQQQSSAPSGERKITAFNVRPVSASPQRMGGFSFNPPSSQSNYDYE